MPGARVERACPAFQAGALTATASLANLVEEEGLEPSFAGCRPAVLPLNDSPKEKCLRAGELNATRMAYEASMTPVHLPALEIWSGKLGSNQRPLDYRSSAQPTELLPDGAPRKNRTRFTALQERRIASNACGAQNLEPAERIERSSVAYHATALPLSYTGWSRRADSNRHLSFTRARFFPLNYFDNMLGASNRIRTGVRTMARSNPSR